MNHYHGNAGQQLPHLHAANNNPGSVYASLHASDQLHNHIYSQTHHQQQLNMLANQLMAGVGGNSSHLDLDKHSQQSSAVGSAGPNSVESTLDEKQRAQFLAYQQQQQQQQQQQHLQQQQHQQLAQQILMQQQHNQQNQVFFSY